MAAFTAAGAGDRRFQAAWTLLRFSGLSPVLRWNVGRRTPVGGIDQLRSNGWCGGVLQAEAVPQQIVRSPEQLATVQALLPELPAWPDFTGSVVLARAGTHPGEPRLAEALHRVVRSEPPASAARSAATARSRAPLSNSSTSASRRARGRRRRPTGSTDQYRSAAKKRQQTGRQSRLPNPQPSDETPSRYHGNSPRLRGFQDPASFQISGDEARARIRSPVVQRPAQPSRTRRR